MRQDHIHFSWAYIYSYIYTSQNKCFSIFVCVCVCIGRWQEWHLCINQVTSPRPARLCAASLPMTKLKDLQECPVPQLARNALKRHQLYDITCETLELILIPPHNPALPSTQLLSSMLPGCSSALPILLQAHPRMAPNPTSGTHP